MANSQMVVTVRHNEIEEKFIHDHCPVGGEFGLLFHYRGLGYEVISIREIKKMGRGGIKDQIIWGRGAR